MNTDTGTWDHGELEDLFFWLQRVLQKYAENPQCQECLSLAGDGLAQIRLGLDAVGRDDVVQLCEEMHRVVSALSEERIEQTPEGAELLVRSALQLSVPIGLTAAGPERLARVLLPLVNDLRQLRGAGALMTPAIVMTPGSIAESHPPLGSAGAPRAGVTSAWVRSLHEKRKRFQHGLLELLQGRDLEAATCRLADTANAIAQVLPAGDLGELFRVTARVAAALGPNPDGTIDSVKPLLGRVDRQLGNALRQIESALDGGRDPASEVFAVDRVLAERLAAILNVMGDSAPGPGVPDHTVRPPAQANGKVVVNVGLEPGDAAPMETGYRRSDSAEGGPKPVMGGFVPGAAKFRSLYGDDSPDPAGPGSMAGQRSAPLIHDHEVLDSKVLPPGTPPPEPAVLAAFDAVVSDLREAFFESRKASGDMAAAESVEGGFRVLHQRARDAAPRLGEFARILEHFVAVSRAAGGTVDTEAAQVIEDAVNVLPGLLAEVRSGGAATTPVADIVLRVEAIIEEGFDDPAMEQESGGPDVDDSDNLARMRRQGGAEMARLAAAFAALDDDTTQAFSDSGSRTPAAAAALEAARSRAAEVAAWHSRVVDALTQVAGHTQMLEGLVARFRSGFGKGLADEAQPTEAGAGFATTGEDLGLLLEELEQLHLALGATVGNATAALLQHQRAIRALQDRLAADSRDGDGGAI